MSGREVTATLDVREQTYGAWTENARIAQNVKRAMQDSPNWPKLKDFQREALDLIATKLGRILNGDPDFVDSWHDIGGYAKLPEIELMKKSHELEA